MAVAHKSYSPAVDVAWKIAANTARSTGSTIEGVHLLYGIFSLDKVPCETLPAENRYEVQSDVARLGKIFTRASVTFQQARRNIRAQLGITAQNDQSKEPADGRNAPSRSPACRQAFEQAALAPNNAHGAQVRLIPLTRCLLEREPTAASFLDLDETGQAELLKALVEGDDPSHTAENSIAEDMRGTMSVFASLDADAVDDSKVNWARVGEHFAGICELTWRAGTSSKIEKLYDDSIQRLMAAIPAAQQAAILTHDPCGNLLLKAHYPKGVFPVSSSSARKAIEKRESFIWQRGGDMSVSQLESGLRAGIYAPILAAGQVFGVVCVDAKSAASRFTNDDLFLVTSLGHQLGLTLANRAAEESLRSSAKLLERLLTNFSPQVRSRLLLKAEAGRLKLGGERSVISILCSDIRGFTNLTENMDAEEVVAMLNDYFTALVSVIFRHGGTVDKFIGDAVMAVFGSPEAEPMHAEKSLRAALEMQVEVKRVSALREAAGLPHCEIGIGVHTGEVIHGFIGSNERMEFTVIGSAVNLASRYCSAARGGDVIISAEILERVWKSAVVESVDVPTKHEGMLSAYRLVQMRAPD